MKELIIDVPDYPIKGVVFKDITPLLASPIGFKDAVTNLSDICRIYDPDIIVSPEARGFIFGSAVASELECGFVPVRKPGKLPRVGGVVDYKLEYGSDRLELPYGVLQEGDRVVIVDDLLATGGTVKAIYSTLERVGVEVLAIVTLIELKDLKGSKKFKDIPVKSVLQY